MSPMKYEQGSYIPEDDILHGHCREYLKSPMAIAIMYNWLELNKCRRLTAW
jgi:hypothetical protein